MNSGPDAAPPSSRDASVDDREYLDTLAAHGESDQVGGDAESNSLDDALETGLDPESGQREPTSPGSEVGPDASQLDSADEGPESSESAPPAPHEAGLGIHLLELDGRFIYAGTAPIQLAHAQPDGSPLTPEQIESVKRFGLPTSKSIGPMAFSSQDEALAAAHAAGVPVVLGPGNVPVETAPFAITSAPDPDVWETYQQPDSPAPRDSGPEYWENDQEKVKRLEELEDRAGAVGASDLAEDIRETRRQDPEIIVASEISGLQEAVAEAEEMTPKSETQGPRQSGPGQEPSPWEPDSGPGPREDEPRETQDPEPTLVQRIRQCIGDDAPKPEKLIEVYVNGDAEDRAYLDGLGVGDLAARHGHRVNTKDAALVEDALDDGWVTGEEASAAGRVQNLAERETPDPIVPSYSITQEEFEERIRELCDDPEALAAFEEQVEAEAIAAKRERKFKAKQLGEDPAAAAAQDVSDDLRSEAGEVLGKRARQAAADRDGLLEGLQGGEREQAREELEAAGVLTPRKRTWTAKQLRKKAKELCPPGSVIRQTRGARRSTLPKPPKPPSTSAPKARRRAKKPAFTAGMRR